jgi:hypothetical protein
VNHRILKIWTACFGLLVLSACTKIDSTKLGSELIPAVDNVKTFETTLEVIANNYVDTMAFSLNSTNPHMVGAISQDPVFGTSKATMFFQMAPSSFPYKFVADSIKGNSKVGFDSAVLILDYVGYYGDSLIPANFKLYQTDSVLQKDLGQYPHYTLNANLNVNKGITWGSKTMNAFQFKDTSLVIRKGDTTKVTKQLRIRLDSAMARQLLLADTNEVYANDTLYRSYLAGFALEAEGAVNTLFYYSLAGNSKIEFFIRKNPLSPTQDTTSVSFTVNSHTGHAVKFENNHDGSELSTNLIPDPVNGKKDIYIQSSPGTYATLRIPGLDTFRNVNRVIHRAELRVVQSEPRLDFPQLVAPQALYLDIIDTANNAFRGVPYDLNPFGVYYCYPGAGINFEYFGGFSSRETATGELNIYRFNIARYLQGVLSKGEPLFPMFRLSAPFYMFYKECANGGVSYPQQVFTFTQSGTLLVPPGFGRIKLAGGEKAGVDPSKRMQLRIIYSTL